MTRLKVPSASLLWCLWSQYLVRVQRDPQAQFGHSVLLQQLEVRAERHAERPGHVLRQPAVVGRVSQAIGLVVALEEEHLRQTPSHSVTTQTQSRCGLPRSCLFCVCSEYLSLDFENLNNKLCRAGLHVSTVVVYFIHLPADVFLLEPTAKLNSCVSFDASGKKCFWF